MGDVRSQSLVTSALETQEARAAERRGNQSQDQRGKQLRALGGSRAVSSPFPGSLVNKHLARSEGRSQDSAEAPAGTTKPGRGYLALGEERQASVMFGGARDRSRGGKCRDAEQEGHPEWLPSPHWSCSK